jgi:phenylalanyl-tRNA synthetase beta chain
MLISQNWLKEFVDFTATPEELERVLTMLGLEVDKIDRPGEKLKNFVVGAVLTKEKHPNADKLSVCTVDVGGGVVNTIVCGAANVAAGQKVPIALDGAVMPNGGFTIEKRKLRGVESNGMICSKAELGFADTSDGIWELEADAPTGGSLAQYLALDDVLYEISITPDRADCLSHLGVAREIAAYYHLPLRKPVPNLVEDASTKTSDHITITIEDTEVCWRFSARVVRGVQIQPSPKWLQDRLNACGQRPINNVVDVTNYVMLECGKPIHAFDLDKVAQKNLVVKRAVAGETFRTLDGKDRILDAEMTMIADRERSSAVGGIMGGEVSEISNDTVNVCIESAIFKPSAIRKTAKKLGISSDASYRFERGVDPETCVYAAERAAELIQQVAGGSIVSGLTDIVAVPQPPKQATVRFARADTIIGKKIPPTEQRELLERLGCLILSHTDTEMLVQIPTYRVDVETEIDVIEEIARLHGYDNIPPALVSRVNLNGEQTPQQYRTLAFATELLSFFRSNGFYDVVTQNMIDPKAASLFTPEPIRIANPLGEDLSCMRPSLLPSMLRVIERNHRYGQKNLRLVELGATFTAATEPTFIHGIREEQHLCAVLTGNATPHKYWDAPERPFDFYDAKGLLESVVQVCGFAGTVITPVADFGIHPLFSANSVELLVHGVGVGVAGELSPSALKSFDVETPVFAMVVNISGCTQISVEQRKYASVSPYPTVQRDLAFVLDTSIDAGLVRNTIFKSANEILREVRIFDVFQGKYAVQTVGEGKKSVAFGLEFNSFEKTLEDAEVEANITAIVQSVQKEFGASLRG